MKRRIPKIEDKAIEVSSGLFVRLIIQVADLYYRHYSHTWGPRDINDPDTIRRVHEHALATTKLSVEEFRDVLGDEVWNQLWEGIEDRLSAPVEVMLEGAKKFGDQGQS